VSNSLEPSSSARRRASPSSTRPLGDVTEFRNEIVHPKDNPQGLVTFVGLEHIERDTGVRIGSEQINLEDMTGRRARFFAGDIVYGYLRPYLNKVWIAEFEGICSVDQYVLKVRPEADRNYIARFLRSTEFLQTAPIDATPGQLPRIRSGELAGTPVLLPPLDEQRRIAAILDQADDLRRKRREALELLERLVWGIFYTEFGEPEANPNGFSEMTFGKLIVDGPTNGLYKPSSAYRDDGIRILRINNFYDGRIEDPRSFRRLRASQAELQTYGLSKDDIVINRVNSREYLGKSALIPELQEPTVFESNMMRLRIDTTKLAPIFCIAFLQTDFIKRQIAARTKDAVNQSSINQSDVRSFKFLVPPLDLQRAFAARVAEIDALKAHHRAHLEKLDALFASLQHRAFRGEL